MVFSQNRSIAWVLAGVCVPIYILALFSAHTKSGGNFLLVKTRDASQSQYLPAEFERLLESPGYEWILKVL